MFPHFKSKLSFFAFLFFVASASSTVYAEDFQSDFEVLDQSALSALGDDSAIPIGVKHFHSGHASHSHVRATILSDEFFSKLWDAYPDGEASDVKSLIGGRVDAAWIENTCPIRLSRAFNYSGRPIPNNTSLHTLSGSDGKRYSFRLSEFIQYLRQTLGKPSIAVSLRSGDEATKLSDAVAGHRGIIVFIVRDFSDASGHIDLWNGEAAHHEAYFERASSVYLWE